ncbi:radical SAM family heme chaperone HemW [Leeia sp. TBRC 13508]|uniref:Heme chaperone HemW n=1 Tax=Leeia speluncae TaxID=2884804 RepID=A0ABS8D4Z7_9NEIS|nr:radical SAM family heme chaperone HemW [Leeia speluncae]MCB6183259.1 radical SAM family heme chaperone HemW [Leeia speluncae]
MPVGKSNWQMTSLPPLSLYVHIPWCLKKCPYCDFNSHEKRGDLAEDAYIDSLILDLESALPLIWGRRVITIFFGGGTPSLLSAKGLDRILEAFRARLRIHTDAEITLEANPGTFEIQKFKDYRAAGITRLSIGIQSFNQRHLKALGRVHDSEEAKRAVNIAAETFDTFNLDLMYGLPNQTLAEAMEDIETALSFSPKHLSCYHLTLEPNTLFYRYPPELPDDDLTADMQESIENRLAAAGFEHYETSAFAQKGHRCQHNLNYWSFGDYLGIGAGAHGKLSFHDKILRQIRHKQPTAYMENVANSSQILEEHAVELTDLPFEFMMNTLRLTEGFPVELFAQHTGLPINRVGKALQNAESEGLITRNHEMITPTLKGQRFLNQLLHHFLPA